MKRLIAPLFALALLPAAQADEHKLTQRWESPATLKTPEGVRFDPTRKLLYVSNIDGEPWAKDGKGSIGKVDLDGQVIAAEWVTGLNCPKGLALSDDGKWLYVADADGVAVIDIDAARITQRIDLPGAAHLNDIVNDAGTLYVTDSETRRIYAVKDGKASVHLEGDSLKGPNGVLVHEGRLYVLDDNSLKRQEADRSLTVLADGMPGGVDGVEHVGNGDFLVSVWSGALWYLPAGGAKQLLFDGKAVKTNTADFAWDAATRTVYVPTFFRNSVLAFELD
ncbi:MAG: ATP/GTP-binding protein [Gammaproteobacteria bacterium]|nr:ATP/GTP-binding protein [Gammaproteobacteria bacterium]